MRYIWNEWILFKSRFNAIINPFPNVYPYSDFVPKDNGFQKEFQNKWDKDGKKENKGNRQKKIARR